MSEAPMRLICEYPTGTLRNAVTVANIGTVANTLKQLPGVGKPFLIFETLPGAVAAADFEHYQNDDNTGPRWVVSTVFAENVAMINDQLANPPLDALTFVA